MPAIWTTPITWNVDQLVTNDDLNEQVRDNLEYLLSPNHQRIVRDNGGDYSITNVTTFQDVDSTNLSISLTTHGGPVLVHWQFVGRTNGTAHEAYYDIALDGVRIGAAHTLGLGNYANLINIPISISALITPLLAGTYVLRPQWRSGASDTISIICDTTSHPVIFEAIEL